jgi:hypothetical protein
VVDTVQGNSITSGDRIGIAVLTTITVTCIVFERIEPILTQVVLKKAGEVDALSAKN